MRTIQAVEMSCGDCGNVALYWTLHDAEKAEWLRYTDTGQDLCPDCAAKEKPDTASEIVELRAHVQGLKQRIEKLENTLRDVRAMRDKTQDILNKVTRDIGWREG